MQEGQRRPLARRSLTYSSFGLGVAFWFVAQAALVFTAAKDEGGKNSCFTDPTKPPCKNADDYCESPFEAMAVFAVPSELHLLGL